MCMESELGHSKTTFFADARIIFSISIFLSLVAAMMATGTVLLIMNFEVTLITDPTSSSTGIFILARFDHTVSRREPMFSITPLGKELSMPKSRTLTVL